MFPRDTEETSRKVKWARRWEAAHGRTTEGELVLKVNCLQMKTS